jgi:hypothetical protein
MCCRLLLLWRSPAQSCWRPWRSSRRRLQSCRRGWRAIPRSSDLRVGTDVSSTCLAQPNVLQGRGPCLDACGVACASWHGKCALCLTCAAWHVPPVENLHLAEELVRLRDSVEWNEREALAAEVEVLRQEVLTAAETTQRIQASATRRLRTPPPPERHGVGRRPQAQEAAVC